MNLLNIFFITSTVLLGKKIYGAIYILRGVIILPDSIPIQQKVT